MIHSSIGAALHRFEHAPPRDLLIIRTCKLFLKPICYYHLYSFYNTVRDESKNVLRLTLNARTRAVLSPTQL